MQRARRSRDPLGAASQTALPAAGFDYDLPAEQIAQHPSAERDGARLLVVQRGQRTTAVDSTILELPRWLARGDLLVINRSRVIPARLRGRRLPGGGAVELLLLAPLGAVSPASGGAATGLAASPPIRVEEPGERWRALARPARRLRPGQRVAVAGYALQAATTQDRPPTGRDAGMGGFGEGRPSAEIELTVTAIGDGWVDVAFPAGIDVLALTAAIGETPLPPYIRRPGGPTTADAERYQTVFAREPGSVAAPTAGLHLSRRLLAALREAGVELVEVVLHVGPATFLAGQSGRSALAVEPERYEVPRQTAQAIERTRGRGRVVAVGTTTTRALESAARAGWPEGMQDTDLVLLPGADFRVIDGLLTNFHLPGSSLLALVAAFAGVDCAQEAYQVALDRGYRFYSFGDAMLVR